jgi:hypothetical protein
MNDERVVARNFLLDAGLVNALGRATSEPGAGI